MKEWPVTEEQIQPVLNKILASGSLLRIPKHPAHRQIVMAFLSLHLERRYPYSESELKGVLNDALDMFNSRVDHVTCRRYLVDLGFLKRDRAGSRYYLNYLKLAEILVSTVTLEHAQVMTTTALNKRNRKKQLNKQDQVKPARSDKQLSRGSSEK